MIEVDTLKLLPHPTNKNMFTILRGDYKATVIEITDIKLEDNSLVFNLTVYEMYFKNAPVVDVFLYADHKEKLKPLVANTIIQVLLKKMESEKND